LGSVVAERRLAEGKVLELNQGLRRKVEELQTIFNVLPVGVGMSETPDCQHIIPNPVLARMLEVSQGMNVSLSAPRDEPAATYRVLKDGVELKPEELPMQVAGRGREIQALELDIVHTDGRSMKLLCSARPLHDEAGKIRGSVGVFLDVTDLNRGAIAQAYLGE